MKACDLNTPSARLRQALKNLLAAKEQISEEWSDDTYRRFNEAFLQPLDPCMRRTIAAIGELAEVLARVEKDCGGY